MKKISEFVDQIICCDALTGLKDLPDQSIDCSICSPPYFGLRDYRVNGQIGLEKMPQFYIDNLCDIFDELKRVLKDDGTCWVVLGDSYLKSDTNKFKGWHKTKQLALIPCRFAIEMQNRGWLLRNKIIWHKRNCLPQSAKDRFTHSYEEILFFVKQSKYNFTQQFEPFSPNTDTWYRRELREGKQYSVKKPYKGNTPYATAKAQNPSDTKRRILEAMKTSKGRNKRSVWDINTKPFKGAHFAVFPQDLVEPMINAGCPENGIVLDFFVGSGTTALVAKKLNRHFLGFDLNPEYCEIAKARLQ